MVVVAGAWLRIRSVAETVPAIPAAEGGTLPASFPSPAPGNSEPAASGSTGQQQRDTSPYRDREAAAAGLSPRDKRYRELLNAPPPPAPKPPAPPETSMISRVTSAIGNALGANRKVASVPRPVKPETPTTARSGGAASAAGRGEDRDVVEETPATSTAEEQDPETDITPPQLQTVVFTPAEIRDEETTTLIATIVDNKSGVRSVSGVIASPSGSVQGFSAVREGEPNHFVARVKVPRDAPAGIWTVKYMTLIDNSANSAHLNQSQGALPATASFRVISSAADDSGPQLASIWLARPAMRNGERNTVFVKAEDNQAGVSLVSGMFVSPGRNARLGFGCRAASGGTWECPLTAPACVDCGIWRLEQVQVQDKAGNLATFRTNHEAVSGVVVDISGDQCDGVPPSITMITIEPSVVSNAQANTVQVKAIVQDQGPCGVASVSGQAVPPGGVGGQRHPIMFRSAGDGQTFIGTLNLQQAAVRGQWSISWMQVLDRGNNLKAYSGSDPAIASATFQVE